jgi:hypothetical protein
MGDPLLTPLRKTKLVIYMGMAFNHSFMPLVLFARVHPALTQRK